MVVAYSIDRKSLAEHRTELVEASEALARLRGEMLSLADRDAACYRSLNELQRLDDGDARRVEIPAAARAATQVPIDVARRAVEVLRLCDRLRAITNPHLASDLRIAGGLAEAVVRTSGENVGANLGALAKDDRGWPGPVMEELGVEARALLASVMGQPARSGE
jgi:formiminotetrahydrofolate cyclodeaminase